ncbi:MAG TPA: methionine adenosyltransferase, partial [Campylobacteraceae bacterium]|nr:methionine adenosyltransferase [Campylobacteraceae bacterium]
LVDTHGTSCVDDTKLERCVREFFRLTPRGIIESLDLLRPIYKKTAAYGHFGREEAHFSWEKIDKVSQIRDFFGLPH